MTEKKNGFLGAHWLLGTSDAVKLYHDVALPLREEVGIIDVHTHHNLRQIVENDPFPNIWRAEVLEEKFSQREVDLKFLTE